MGTLFRHDMKVYLSHPHTSRRIIRACVPPLITLCQQLTPSTCFSQEVTKCWPSTLIRIYSASSSIINGENPNNSHLLPLLLPPTDGPRHTSTILMIIPPTSHRLRDVRSKFSFLPTLLITCSVLLYSHWEFVYTQSLAEYIFQFYLSLLQQLFRSCLKPIFSCWPRRRWPTCSRPGGFYCAVTLMQVDVFYFIAASFQQ